MLKPSNCILSILAVMLILFLAIRLI